ASSVPTPWRPGRRCRGRAGSSPRRPHRAHVGARGPCLTGARGAASANPTRLGLLFDAVSTLQDARAGMDLDIRPQDDLFGHVNGRWLDEAEIPVDRSSWGPFVELTDQSEQQVHAIIESLAASGGDDADS